MSGHHHHDHDHDNHFTPIEARVKALESLMVAKGYVDPAALDAIVETYETRVGPRNGARVVARAWTDAGFAQRLRADGSAAVAEMGYGGRGGEHIVACFNTPQEHNLIVCTLCSCYPWPVLGLPPVWYKSPPYRAKAVLDPRGTLADFGVTLPEGQRIRVWDSTAETRFIVIPMRPEGTEGWSEDKLAAIVNRDSMIGTGLPRVEDAPVNGAQDLGGQMGFGPVVPERDEPIFHAEWEKRVLAINVAAGAMGAWTIDGIRSARESLPPAQYLSASYYEIWLAGLHKVLVAHGFLSKEELEQGRSLAPAKTPRRVLKGEEVPAVLRNGFPYEREASAPAAFAVGDAVRTIVINPQHHTRLPRYARGKRGVIERITGCHVFPDTGAQGQPETAQWLYTVVFEATELWGRNADPTSTVSIEAWESYLEPA